MTPEDRTRILQKVEERLETLPWYVGEFINYRVDASPNTLNTYTRDYIGFFDWIVAEGLDKGPREKIHIHTLESLRTQDIINYQRHCLNKLNNKLNTVARKLSSLKTLFHYLSQIAEDESLYPYLQRNVMAKIDIRKEKISETKRAELIASKILVDDEIQQFREFVAHGYGEQIKEYGSVRQYKAYLRNRERDLALVSLLLGSGLRIDEALSIDTNEIDWQRSQASITRKGDSIDVVSFSNIAKEDMLEYQKIRHKYGAPKQERGFFLSYKTGKGGIARRLTVRAAQKMFEKYATAFGRSAMSLHKLRHSFATKHYQENKDVALLKRILNHSNVDTTMIYTHVFDEQIKKSINKSDF